jgi:hypothetical protein
MWMVKGCKAMRLGEASLCCLNAYLLQKNICSGQSFLIQESPLKITDYHIDFIEYNHLTYWPSFIANYR